MDISIYENNRVVGGYNISDIGNDNDIPFDDDYFEVRTIDCCF